MYLNLSHVTANPMVLSSAILALVGWLVLFICTCVVGTRGVIWWIIVYELMLLMGLYIMLAKSATAHYLLMMLVFLGTSIAMLTELTDMLLHLPGQASKAGAAGSIILIMMQFFWVFILGSSQDSWLHQAIYGLHHAQSAQPHHHQRRQQDLDIEKTIVEPVASPPSPAPRSISNTSLPPPQIAVTPNYGLDPHPQKKDYVVAIHSYRANPDDPNELSFEQDETLEILDRAGNWWQARKGDGTIGIVPSNYVKPK